MRAFNSKWKYDLLPSFAFLRLRRTWSFQVVLQRKAKKCTCTKIYNARAQLLIWLLNLLFSDVLVAVVVEVCSSSLVNVFRQRDESPQLIGIAKVKWKSGILKQDYTFQSLFSYPRLPRNRLINHLVRSRLQYWGTLLSPTHSCPVLARAVLKRAIGPWMKLY